jgi:Ca2+-binding RTX toxin-like protein
MAGGYYQDVDILNQVIQYSAEFDDGSGTGGDTSYPFSTNPDYFEQGQDLTLVTEKLDAPAADGSIIVVYGAFGPMSAENPFDVTSSGTLTGTHMGDILTVNREFEDPTSTAFLQNLATGNWTVMAFDGDDIIFSGLGPDTIYGGLGDDTIYGVGTNSDTVPDTFLGEEGDDHIYLGWVPSWSIVDGGDGTDTVDFTYLVTGLHTGVTLDLSIVPDSDPGNHVYNGSAENSDNNVISLFDITNVENVIGSPKDDTITGSAEANNIKGGLGSDFYLGKQPLWVNDQLTIDDADILKIVWRTNPVTLTPGSNMVDLGDGTSFTAVFEDGTTAGDGLRQYLSDDGGSLVLVSKTSALDSAALQMHLGGNTPTTEVSSADDLVLGTSGDERLTGRGGDDLLHGFDGSDFLGGGRGDDILVGGAGALDVLRGGPGADIFAFRDELRNGVHEQDLVQDFDPLEDAVNLGGHRVNGYVEMADSLLLMVGRDQDAILLRGVSDIDSVVLLDDGENRIGPLGSDAVEYDFVVTERNPGLGLPRIAASSADDLVLGTARDETLKGVGGDDLLLGFDGSDYVAGGRGDDILAGGAGELDTLRGGPGADTFVFRDELDNGVREKDVIQDFNPLEDAIDLGGYRIGSHVETADSLLLTVGPDGDEILLRGVTDIDSVVLLDGPEPGIEPDALEQMLDAAQQPDWLA